MPVRRLRPRPDPLLLPLGVAAVVAQPYLPGLDLPSTPDLRAHAVEAARVYAHAGFAAQTAFRWRETLVYILPLLVGVAVKTYGLMLGGMAVWRAGLIRDRDLHRRAIWIACAVALAAWSATREHIPLAIAYGAALLAWRPSERAKRLTAPFAAAAAALGVALYAGQLWFSVRWLARHRFGPFQWLWRSLAYGRRV